MVSLCFRMRPPSFEEQIETPNPCRERTRHSNSFTRMLEAVSCSPAERPWREPNSGIDRKAGAVRHAEDQERRSRRFLAIDGIRYSIVLIESGGTSCEEETESNEREFTRLLVESSGGGEAGDKGVDDPSRGEHNDYVQGGCLAHGELSLLAAERWCLSAM